ncbi:Pycsar system effector family protein [uncultured Winogradskyella sp.]|uniref:Pycsar system effector family protein n=1 Tax=uncultured Winogradskyella sp. TaxID=395353 RepID=UPI0026188FA2|nr:Pycsar system effector family protein [uncultured Winogradskyella sp.]
MAQDPNNYWEQLERLEKLIRASELKAGVIFSFHSLILGLFVDRIERFKDVFMENTVLLVLLICWFIFVAISIFYCFRCFRPFMEMSYDKNVFFFRDAVTKFGSTENYTKELIKTCNSDEELYQLLAEQIHAESKIINEKFRNVQKSILFFAISFLFVIVTSVYWILFT